MRKLIFLLAVAVPVHVFAQIEPGTDAPEITLEEIYNKSDKEIPTLQSLRGEIVVLDFWAIWCSPCVAAFPENNELYNKYKDKGVHLIAITDDPKEKLENFLKKVDIRFWIGRDADKTDFKNYEVRGRPEMYIINRNGNVVYQGNHVTAEMLEEVIATDAVSGSQEKTQKEPKVILNGGFSPGEDPLYNGVKRMLGYKPSHTSPLIDHFIIRPSLDTAKDTYYGNRATPGGYVGVTYYGGELDEIYEYLMELPSSLWIKNNTGDTTSYDIVYWKKAFKPIEKSLLEEGQDISEEEKLKIRQRLTEGKDKAFKEISQSLENGVSIRIDSIRSENSVNRLSLGEAHKEVKKYEDIEDGAQKAYTPIRSFASLLEEKSGEYFLIDSSLEDMYIPNQGMEWKKMHDSNAEEVVEFLKSKGIRLKQETQPITLYEINNR